MTLSGTSVPNLRGNLMSYWFHTGPSTLSAKQVAVARRTVDERRGSHGLAAQYEWHPRDEFGEYGLDYAAFCAKYDDAWGPGWRLRSVRPHARGASTVHSAVWRTGTHGEIQKFDASYESYRKRYDELWGQGWRLDQLRVHTPLMGRPALLGGLGAGHRARDPAVLRDIRRYRAKYDELWGQGWRLHQLAPYAAGSSVRRSVVWRKSTSPEIQLHGASYQSPTARSTTSCGARAGGCTCWSSTSPATRSATTRCGSRARWASSNSTTRATRLWSSASTSCGTTAGGTTC